MNKKFFFAAMIITVASHGVLNAQPAAKIPRIGIIAPGKSPQLDALRQGLRDFGYTEGQNLLIDYRYVEGKPDRIPELVAELLDLKIDIIVPMGPLAPVVAKIVKSTPVVFGTSSDPVETRPG